MILQLICNCLSSFLHGAPFPDMPSPVFLHNADLYHRLSHSRINAKDGANGTMDVVSSSKGDGGADEVETLDARITQAKADVQQQWRLLKQRVTGHSDPNKTPQSHAESLSGVDAATNLTPETLRGRLGRFMSGEAFTRASSRSGPKLSSATDGLLAAEMDVASSSGNASVTEGASEFGAELRGAVEVVSPSGVMLEGSVSARGLPRTGEGDFEDTQEEGEVHLVLRVTPMLSLCTLLVVMLQWAPAVPALFSALREGALSVPDAALLLVTGLPDTAATQAMQLVSFLGTCAGVEDRFGSLQPCQRLVVSKHVHKS